MELLRRHGSVRLPGPTSVRTEQHAHHGAAVVHIARLFRCRHLVSWLYDITERQIVEQRIARSEERLNLALRGANLGMYDCTIDDNHQIVEVSPR